MTRHAEDTYHQALGQPDAQDAYDLYWEASRQEHRKEFDAGNHDYDDFELFFKDGDVVSYSDFYEEWHREQEELARERRW